MLQWGYTYGCIVCHIVRPISSDQNRSVIWGGWWGRRPPPKEKKEKKKEKKEKKKRKKESRELWITSNYYVLSAVFPNFQLSGGIEKYKKNLAPQEKVEITLLDQNGRKTHWSTTACALVSLRHEHRLCMGKSGYYFIFESSDQSK